MEIQSPAMPTPQQAIFVADSSAFYALEYRCRPGTDPQQWRAALASLHSSELLDTQRLIAFGSGSWRKLAPELPLPALIPFHTVHGAGERVAIGSQGDLLLWFHGKRQDLVFDAARSADALLQGVAHRDLAVPGFRYLDSRDLTGFIDGTENPVGDERHQVALVPDGEPGAGGSYVLSQKWVHALDAFAALPLAEQEQVIGRTKADSRELEGLPASSHVGRADVKVDGLGLKLYRRSFPFGDMAEQGLYFLGFSAELIRFAIILDRMFGCSGDGIHDRLTDFSEPVSGAYWFAPAQQQLDALLAKD